MMDMHHHSQSQHQYGHYAGTTDLGPLPRIRDLFPDLLDQPVPASGSRGLNISPTDRPQFSPLLVPLSHSYSPNTHDSLHSSSTLISYGTSVASSRGSARPIAIQAPYPYVQAHHRDLSSSSSSVGPSYDASTPRSIRSAEPRTSIRSFSDLPPLRTQALSAPASPSDAFTVRSPESPPQAHEFDHDIDNDEDYDDPNDERPYSPPDRTDLSPSGRPRRPKKHACFKCPKRFTRPSDLEVHLRTHTGSQPYRCPYPSCGRLFSVNSNMRRHYRTHDPMATLPARAGMITLDEHGQEVEHASGQPFVFAPVQTPEHPDSRTASKASIDALLSASMS